MSFILLCDIWKCAIRFLKLVFRHYSLKHPNAEPFHPACLSLSACGFDHLDSQSPGSTETEWETLCPLSSATVEKPSSSWFSVVAQWHKALKTVLRLSQHPSFNILHGATKLMSVKKVHMCSQNFQWRGLKINNSISQLLDGLFKSLLGYRPLHLALQNL